MVLGVVRKAEPTIRENGMYRQKVNVDTVLEDSNLTNVDITAEYDRYYEMGDIIVFYDSAKGDEPVQSFNFFFEVSKGKVKFDDYAAAAELIYELEKERLKELEKIVSMKGLQKESELSTFMSKSLEEQKLLLNTIWENYKEAESRSKIIESSNSNPNPMRPYWSELNSELNRQNTK